MKKKKNSWQFKIKRKKKRRKGKERIKTFKHLCCNKQMLQQTYLTMRGSCKKFLLLMGLSSFITGISKNASMHFNPV